MVTDSTQQPRPIVSRCLWAGGDEENKYLLTQSRKELLTSPKLHDETLVAVSAQEKSDIRAIKYHNTQRITDSGCHPQLRRVADRGRRRRTMGATMTEAHPAQRSQ